MARDDSDGAHLRRLNQQIYAVVRRIPRGRVATYGQVAELAGIPGGARVVGAAMRVSEPVHRLPWQRVIAKRGPATGRIAILDPIGGAVQRQLLENEGVEVTDAGGIPLARYGWLALDRSAKLGVRRRQAATDSGATPRQDARRKSSTASRGRGAPPRRRPRSGSTRRASPSRH